METTEAQLERAFQEWSAMMGVPATNSGKPGSFRLGRDDSGKVRIEQVVGEGGEVHESLSIKTVQVARAVSKRRRSRP